MTSMAQLTERRGSPVRWVLGGLEAVIALSAAGGAAYGLAGAPGVETSWLDGSPFGSYVVPSIVLLVAVGGGAAVALAALIAGGRRAGTLAVAAGGILVGWIAVEVIWIPFSPLQPACVLAGLAMIVLGHSIRP
jgi:hypothetical protein